MALLMLPAAVHAWDYEGHRAVNKLALAGLPPEFPGFVREPAAVERIAFLSGEPDRWRNVTDLPVKHYNAPDHYLDIEHLMEAGIAVETLPDMRQVYALRYALGRAQYPERQAPIDWEKNKDRTREQAGFLPWAITEQFGRLKSAFSYLKAFEEGGGTPDEIANARANVIYLMGVMGHYVGDGAQPLHTTKHFNGWSGENPRGFTTSNRFHSWIDGGFNSKAGLNLDEMISRAGRASVLPTTPSPDGRDPTFVAVMSYLLESFAQVTPLYELDQAGKLKADGSPGSFDGRDFIQARLLRGGEMLGSLWLTAWRTAPPDTFLKSDLAKRQARASAPGAPPRTP